MVHTQDSAARSLSKKASVFIEGKDIYINKDDYNDLGNGSWGKIDYLTKQCGFYTVWVRGSEISQLKSGKKVRRLQKLREAV